MATVSLEIQPVGRKRNTEPHRKPLPVDPPMGRIELVAEPAWIEQLDAAAKALGVSRSAYIRMACNRQMSSDRREGPPGN